MTYTKNTWVDQNVTRPRTYTVTTNQDSTITLTDSFGVVTELGTPVNATNMNHIEQGIYDNDSRITTIENNYANKSLSNLTTTGSNKFDGQWVDIGTGSPIANEITITTTATQLDVSSYLPNDNNSYLVVFFANFKSSTAYTQLSITGSNTSGFSWGVRAGAANILGGGSGLCLIDTNRKINLQTVSQTGVATLYINSARRMGA